MSSDTSRSAQSDDAGGQWPLCGLSGRRLAAVSVFFLLLAWGLYGHTVGYPFAFDDEHNVRANHVIRIRELSFDSLWQAVVYSPSSSRPVANLTFALNYYLLGSHVIGFRVINILIHSANGVLVFLSIRLIFGLYYARRKGKNAGVGLTQRAAGGGGMVGAAHSGSRGHSGRRITALALVAAILWFVHPIQIQGVSYVVQRMTSLCVFFYLLALMLYLFGRVEGEAERRKWFYAAAGVSWVVALGSKQIAATFPLLILMIEVFVFGSSLKELYARRKKWILGGLYISIAVAIVCLGTDPLERVTRGYVNRDFTLLQRLMTQWRVVGFYLTLLFYPHPARLNLDHHFPASVGLLSPSSTLLSLLALVGVLVGAAVLFRKRKKVLSFGILWFFLHLVIESTVLPLEMCFEHRLYLPSIGIAMGLVWACDRYARAWWRPKLIAAVGLALLLGLWTVQRTWDWRSRLVLWQDAARKSPHKPRSCYNLGIAYAKKECYPTAMYWFDRAIEVDPDYWEAYLHKGHAFRERGQLKKALPLYRLALEHSGGDHVPHTYIGSTCGQLGDVEKAEAHYRMALEDSPDSRPALKMLAWLLATDPDPTVRNGREALDLALRACRALEARSDPITLRALAAAYAENGNFEKARMAVARAITLAQSYGDEGLIANLRRIQQDFQRGQPYRRPR